MTGTVIGYVRVSTDEQAESGLGLDAQREMIRNECARRGYRIVEIVADEGVSGKDMEARPKLLGAIDRVEAGEAAILMAAKLDRLSRSLIDSASLLQRAKQHKWGLAICDLGVDTSTSSGELMAHLMASVAQHERRQIAERTSDALQAKKRAGATLGRPDRADAETVKRIVRMRGRGMSLRAIADKLNEDDVPRSQRGERWWASTVAAVLKRPDAQRKGTGSRKGKIPPAVS